MEGDTVHSVACLVHQHLCPVPVVVARTTGNLIQIVAVVVAAVGLITTIEVGVVFGKHASAATPTLVTYTEELHLPCLVATVLTTELCHGSVAITGHIFHPLGELLNSAATYVAADVRLATEHLTEIKELVSTEGVVLDGASPVVVLHLWTLFLRTDTVHPVILVGEASARPTENRYLKGLKGVEHILTITIDIRYLGVFTYPQTSVDT